MSEELTQTEQEQVLGEWLKRKWWELNGNAEVLRQIAAVDAKLDIIWEKIADSSGGSGGSDEEPPENAWEVPQWAVERYTNPELSDLSRGLVWARYVGPHDKVSREFQGREKKPDGTFGPPIIAAAKPGTPGRFRFGNPLYNEEGREYIDTFLAYRKPIQGDSDVYIEVCDPWGFYIEKKWLIFPAEER